MKGYYLMVFFIYILDYIKKQHGLKVLMFIIMIKLPIYNKITKVIIFSVEYIMTLKFGIHFFR